MEQGRKSKQRERKESKDQGRKIRIKQLQQEYLQVTFCMCDFLVSLDMHGFACVVYGSLVVGGMVLSGYDNDF